MAYTSLFNQLSSLAEKSQIVSGENIDSSSKKRASLLFKTEDALRIDRETVYRLGKSGLDHLVTLDERFEEFYSIFFDESAKQLERSVADEKTNAALNASIKKFLVLLAPYFQLNSALKVMEWLVNRFHVQKYNFNDIMLLVFPYHELKLFTRVVQVIDPSDKSHPWFWLYEIQKNDVLVTKDQVWRYLSKNLTFLKRLCEYALELMKIHGEEKTSYYVNFLASAIVGAIGKIKPPAKDPQISALLQIIKILSEGESPNLQKCGLTTLLLVSHKVQLDHGLLRKLLFLMVKKLDGKNITQFFQVILSILHAQEEFTFGEKFLKKFYNTCSDFHGSLLDDIDALDCPPLLSPVDEVLTLPNLLENKSCSQFVINVLSALRDSPKLQELIDRIWVNLDLQNESLGPFLNHLLCEFPQQTNLCLNSLQGSNPERVSLLSDFIDKNENHSSLTSQIFSSREKSRMKALGKLFKLVDSGEPDSSNTEFLILTALADPSNAVVIRALSRFDIITSLPSPAKVLDAAYSRFWVELSENGPEPNLQFLELLTKLSDELSFKSIKSLVIKEVCCNALKNLPESGKDQKINFSDAENVSEELPGLIANAWSSRREIECGFLCMMVCSNKKLLAECNGKTFDVLLEILNSKPKGLMKIWKKLGQTFDYFEMEKFDSLLVYCAMNFIKNSAKTICFETNEVWDNDLQKAFSTFLVKIICYQTGNVPKLLQVLGEKKIDVLKFLLLHSDSLIENPEVLEILKSSVWVILASYIKQKDKQAIASLIWPMLISLSDPSANTRQRTLAFITKSHKLCAPYYEALVSALLARSNEIQVDQSQVLKTWAKFASKNAESCVKIIDLLSKSKKNSALLKKSLSFLNGTKSSRAISFLGDCLKEFSAAKEENAVHCCSTILEITSSENIETLFEGFILCLSSNAHKEIVTAALMALTTETFDGLTEQQKVAVFKKLGKLWEKKTDYAEFENCVSHLSLQGSLLHECFGLPGFKPDGKLSRNRDESFSSSSLDITSIRFFLDYLMSSNFDSQMDSKDLFGVLNSLIVFAERAHLSEKGNNLFLNIILQTLTVMRTLLEKSLVSETCVDTGMILGLISSYNDNIHLQSLCFNVLCTFLANCSGNITEKVLPVFSALCTALGNRQDQFTFNLILESVRKILVPLVSGKQKKELRLFLYRFTLTLKLHSNERKILLMDECLKNVDEKNYIWQVIAVLFSANDKPGHSEDLFSFITSLLSEKNLVVTLKTVVNISNFLKSCLVEGRPEKYVDSVSIIPTSEKLTDRQFRLSIIQMFTLLPRILQSESFLAQITEARLLEETYFNEDFKAILTAVLAAQRVVVAKQNSKSLPEVEVQFYKALESKLHVLLSCLQVLFDDQYFASIVMELLDNSESYFNVKGFEMLNSRIVKTHGSFFNSLSSEVLEKFEACILEGSRSDDEKLSQLALLVAAKFVKYEHSFVAKMSDILPSLISNAKSFNVKAQICLLISEMVGPLKDAFLPHLESSVSLLLDDSLFAEPRQKLVYDCFLLCKISILENLENSLGPYIPAILKSCVKLNALNLKEKLMSDHKLQKAAELLSGVNLRTLIDSVLEVYSEFKEQISDEKKFLGDFHWLCSLLANAFLNSPRKDLEMNQQNFSKLVFEFLDFRKFLCAKYFKQEFKIQPDSQEGTPAKLAAKSKNLALKRKISEMNLGKNDGSSTAKSSKLEMSKDFINNAEKKFFEPIIKFLLKGTESSIKPLLLKILQWATGEEKSSSRLLTYYHFMKCLSEQLRGLMILFITPVLSNMKSCLSEKMADLGTQEQMFLNSNILKLMKNVFEFDVQSKVATKERVKSFTECITNQWVLFSGEESFVEFSRETVAPCIAQMMLSCGDEEGRNELHRGVLHYARHSSGKIRLSCCFTIGQIAAALGDEYSSYYPEAVPHLAELKEDNDQAIQQETDAVLRIIHKSVGEAVYEHFPKIE